MTLVRGIDVSRYQTVTSWGQVKQAGIGFVIVKATEGTGSVSSTWRKYFTGARAAGLLVGSYHFAHPKNSPTAEARHYVSELRAVGWKSGRDLPPVLDIEATEGRGRAELTDWCLSFVREVDRLLGLTVPWLRTGFYSNADYYRNRLWGSQVHRGRWWMVASWPNPGGPWPTSDDSVPSPAAIWQWTDRARVPGIKETTDADVCRLAELKQLAPAHYGITPDQAQPAPKPTPPEGKLSTPQDVWGHRINPGPTADQIGGYPKDASYPASDLLSGAEARIRQLAELEQNRYEDLQAKLSKVREDTDDLPERLSRLETALAKIVAKLEAGS